MKKKTLIIVIIALGIIMIGLLYLLSNNSRKPNTSFEIITPPVLSGSQFVVITPTTPLSIEQGRSEAPAEEWQKALDQYKINQLDFYVANFATHDDTTFQMRYIFKKIPHEHYAFIITLVGTDKNKAKQDAIDWIKSKELTDEQIKSLDITYNEQ